MCLKFFLKETYKLKTFADDPVLILQEPNNSTEYLMKKLKDFGALAGFKIHKQKAKLVKNMNKVKYLKVTLINMNCMLFQNYYVKTWNIIKNYIKKTLSKWDKLFIPDYTDIDV